MSAPKPPSRLQLQFLKWQLKNRRFQQTAVNSLTQIAINGSDDALEILGELVVSPNAALQQLTLQSLRTNLPHICPDVLWQIWARTHHLLLEELLRFGATPARARGNKETYLFSLLLLGQPIPAQYLDEKRVPFYVRIATENHPILSASARKALGQLKRETAVNTLAGLWRQGQYPWLIEIIKEAGYIATEPLQNRIACALIQGQPNLILQMGAESIAPLFDFLFDPVLGDAAEFCMRNLSHPAAITEFCALWKKDRNPNLQMIMNDSAYLPQEPSSLRLLCALFNNHPQIAESIPPADVPYLLEYLEDPDLDIKKRAEQAVLHLTQTESKLAVCQYYLENDNPTVKQVLLSSQYLPEDKSDRALLLFLMGQWNKYDSLDFDQTILRIRYQTASFSLRKRILNLIQASGRSDYLAILTAFTDFKKFGTGEYELLIRALEANEAWQELFDLALKTPIRTSIRIFEILVTTRWKPDDALRVLYGQLLDLTYLPHKLDDATIIEALPLAANHATLRINGRVNDVSFSPDDQLIAIATSACRIIVWDYRHGKVHRVIKGFNHSVGRVAYMPDGSMIAAERTSTKKLCSVYHIKDGNAQPIGSHQSSITDVIPVGADRAVTTGSDNFIILWNLSTHQIIERYKIFTDRVRAGAVQPDKQRYAVITDPPVLFDASSGNRISPHTIRLSTMRGVHISTPQHAVFTPSNHLLVGQSNGQIIEMTIHDDPVRRTLFTSHPSRITGLQYLPNTTWAVSTDSTTDQLVFTDIHNPKIQKKVAATAAGITALFVSPSGRFMACGHEKMLTLWDTRLYTIPAILKTPLADFDPGTLPLLNDFLQYPLPVELIRTVLCIKAILERRFVYDIEVADLPHIQPGEFDILIEDGET